MPTPAAVAQRLYDAMAHADGEALFGLLTDDFVGTVSTVMPHGVGGEHRGSVDMITGLRVAGVSLLTKSRMPSASPERPCGA